MSFPGSFATVAPLAGARDTAVCDLGDFFSALTPTPGTGIISSGSVTTFAETTPYLVLYNSGGLTVYPTHLRFHTTVVGAGPTTTAQNWTFTVDVGNRYSSGGTALTVNNTNMNSLNKSGASVYVGAVTATAASNLRRVVEHQAMKFYLETVHDVVNFNFGGPEQVDPASLINNAATLSHSTANLAPIAIGPNQSLVIVRWGASYTTGVTLETAMGWFEK